MRTGFHPRHHGEVRRFSIESSSTHGARARVRSRHPRGVLKRPPWAETAVCSPPAGHSGPEALGPVWLWSATLLISPRPPRERKPKPCRRAARPGSGHRGPEPPRRKQEGTREGNTGHGAPHSPRLQDDVLVQGFLPVREAALQHVLVLLRQLLFHVSLGSPQNKRLRHLKEEHDALFPVHGATRTGDPPPRPLPQPHVPCASV